MYMHAMLPFFHNTLLFSKLPLLELLQKVHTWVGLRASSMPGVVIQGPEFLYEDMVHPRRRRRVVIYQHAADN